MPAETSDISGRRITAGHLAGAFAQWFLCCGGLALFAYLAYRTPSRWTLGALAAFYIYSGFHLDRLVVGRIIRFHPVYNTLRNVTRTKIHLFLFWPLAYVSLFGKLAINRVL